ncbi:hypothetical protein SAMN00808754_1645 [Thermanaeromonas toyohensis ToBE]|uniref:Uncharacterized protein n=1 Tax=Thermanaeromonas toyohensis ToBE TaxID=698762 RepID=A0A1W1VV77_9FIRM|nr:hypothetical protein SAMN00808754_1645 [Thermanaeromonas toyohensis ToBE]
MHALHCLLVEVPVKISPGASAGELDRVKKETRAVALNAMNRYRGIAFDWCSRDDAGRWKDDFPGRGVVLGAEEPERFRELLNEYKDAPLRAAEALLWDLKIEVWAEDWKWPLVMDAVTLERIWKTDVLDGYAGWCLKTALKLVTGDYIFDARFFSVPDDSTKVGRETLEKALANPERYALVFVDCHF